MSTATEFPENQWERLQEEMRAGGPQGVITFIESTAEADRLKLYNFAQGAFWGREWEGKNVDGYIALANATIAEALRRSSAADTPQRASDLKDTANVISYNLSANLAECWPGDDLPRERRHFEEGLHAAENCIRWRDELGKPPDRKSIAWWAKGIHQMSLHDFRGAADSFRTAMELGAEGATAAGRPGTVTQDGDFNVILNSGYLGLAEMAAGTTGGRERYQEACDTFRRQAEAAADAHGKEDAEFGIAQLKTVETKFAPQMQGA